MTKLFESKKIYNEASEHHEKITIYELTQDELTDCEDLSGYELGDYFDIDLRHYPVMPGAWYTETDIEINGVFLIVKEYTALNV
jgi:hypothetical protein